MARSSNFFTTTFLPLMLSLSLVSCIQGVPTPAIPTTPAAATTTEPLAVITYVEGQVFVTNGTVYHRAPGLMAPVPQAATPTVAPTTAAPPAATQAPNAAPTSAPPTIAPPTSIPPPAQPQGEQAATPMQIVAAGATIRTAPDSSATIVCLSGQAYRVTGGQRIAVTSTLCQSAQPLPADSVPAVAPDNGRLVEKNDGSAVIEGETRERESDYGQLPIILSPRNTALLTLTPMLSWVDVTDAIEYELSLSGLSSFAEIIVAAPDLPCTEDVRTAPSRICTYPWPPEWQLEAGQRYFLNISARTGIAAPLRESETSALRALTAAEAAQLQTTLAEIAGLDLDPVTRNLLLAGHYRAYNMLDQAISAYVEAYAAQPTPEIAVALGDVYLAADSQRFAFLAYQNALGIGSEQTQENLAVQAAAEFGIGLVYFSRDNFVEAEPHFGQAVDLYTQIGAQAEREAAQHAREEAEKRRS
ncbi:MAG: hypothetical protein DYG89_10420 [Caldilinea sp. CFX5]|nr:hypothetical protein [Caldilinea sp. CFX5]